MTQPRGELRNSTARYSKQLSPTKYMHTDERNVNWFSLQLIKTLFYHRKRVTVNEMQTCDWLNARGHNKVG